MELEKILNLYEKERTLTEKNLEICLNILGFISIIMFSFSIFNYNYINIILFLFIFIVIYSSRAYIRNTSTCRMINKYFKLKSN